MLNEEKLEQLFTLVNEIVDDYLKVNKGYYDLKEYFVDDIISYILKGTPERIKMLSGHMDASSDLRKLKGMFN